MRIIGKTLRVQAPAKMDDAAHEHEVRGEDHGRTVTVLGWTRQPGAPKDKRWLVSCRLDDGQVVNYYPHELVDQAGAAGPLRPDPEEED